MSWLNGKEILLTGGTGSLGQQLLHQLILHHKPRGIRIFSRDEWKQWELKRKMKERLGNINPTHLKDVPVSFLIGDIRDYQRVKRATEGVDLVIHTAAMKQVPTCEDNPLEAIETNIHGAENILNASLDSGVQKVMNISTDKAVYPINLYGTTKMAAEKLFIQGNVYSGSKGAQFSCCRYGNILGSRGSVVHIFKDQIEKGNAVTITDKLMTRFWSTQSQVADFILARCCEMIGGEIFIPKLPSMKLPDMIQVLWAMAKTTAKHLNIKEIGMRKGEKLHECLIAQEELPYTINLNGGYQIQPNMIYLQKENRLKQAYYSDTNDQWLTGTQFVEMMEEVR